jgi:hypothetical protein
MKTVKNTKSTTSPNGRAKNAAQSKFEKRAVNSPAEIEIYSLAELEDLELPEPKTIVKDIIPVGLVVLAARPKIGKSFFMLDVSLAVAGDGQALRKVDVKRGDVLYLALEDNKRRMQARARKFGRQWPRRLHIAHAWPRLDKGGKEALVAWLESHLAARLVVIDIWKKVRPRRVKGAQLYDEDYEHMAMLQEIAHRFEVAIVVIHHTRKSEAEDPFDEISGSTGITAAVDAALVIHRLRSEKDAQMWIVGKDIEEQMLGLRYEDGFQWHLQGPIVVVPASEAARQIYECVVTRHGKGMTPAEVAKALDKRPGTIRERMRRMVERGELVELANSKYAVDMTHDTHDTRVTHVRHDTHDRS